MTRETTLRPEPHLRELFVHPLKSGRGFSVQAARLDWEGLAWDRRFLVTTPDGVHVTARSHPRMVLVSLTPESESFFRAGGEDVFESADRSTAPASSGVGSQNAAAPLPAAAIPSFTLRAPGCASLTVDFRGAPAEGKADGATSAADSAVPAKPAANTSLVTVWVDTFGALDCGDEAAAWISAFHGEPLRLHYLGESQRPLRWDRSRRMSFADAAPLLVLSRASVAELSRRAGFEVSVRRFRPNLVVDGTAAFEEDGWRKIALGDCEFELIDGCSRCELTTVDPESGVKHPAAEPLETLKKFRETDTGVYFGMNVMPTRLGELRLGDTLRVLQRRRPLFFPDARPGESAPHDALMGPAARAIEAALPAETRAERFEAVCEKIIDETRDAKTFVFRRADGRALVFEAGQFVTFDFDIGGERCYRSYSLSSVPQAGPGAAPQFSITVKRTAGGLASNWLFDEFRPGQSLAAEGPAGRFGLRQKPWETYLFFAAGSGITPFRSILGWMAERKIPADVVLIYSARKRGDIIFERELDGLRERMDGRLRLVYALSGEAGPEDSGGRPDLHVHSRVHRGRLDYALLMEACRDVRDRRILACGPADYRAAVRELLGMVRAKIDLRYSEEAFSPGEEFVPPGSLTLRPGRVDFVKSGTSLGHDGKTTVLKLLEQAGLRLPYSCRAGDCGTCLLRKTGGTLRSFAANSLSAEQEAGGWFLACSSLPDGDLQVDL